MGSNPDQSLEFSRNRAVFIEKLLFLGMVFLQAGYIWLFDWFPTQDGPSHVDNAIVLLKLLSGQTSILNDYYQLNPGTYTNWLGSLLLALLTELRPHLEAEKALLWGYLILAPVSFRYALGGLGQASTGLAYFIFPLLYSRLFFMGFHSFCYSLIFYFVMIGYWFRHRDNMKPTQTTILTLLALVTLLWHLFSLIMAGLIIISTAMGDILVKGWEDHKKGTLSPAKLLRALVRGLSIPGIILLPSLVLVGFFLTHTEGGMTYFINPVRLMGHLILGTVMINFGWWELILSGGYTVVLGLAGWRIFRNRGREPIRGLTVGLALNLAAVMFLYLVMPDETAGGGTISFRLALFVTLSAIILVAGRINTAKAGKFILYGPVLVSILFMVFRYQPIVVLNEHLQEYLSGTDRIESGKTILPVSFLSTGHPLESALAWRVDFFGHAGGYLTAAKGGVNLRNYEARLNYFPLTYQPGKNPYRFIGIGGRLAARPPDLDFSDYSGRTGGRVDYVLLWCYDPIHKTEPAGLAVLAQLDEAYHLIFTSPKGLMKIYKQR